MASFIPRYKIVEKLRSKISEDEPIIIAGVSTGHAAISAEKGGADLLLFYNSGRYRIMGIGSLAGLLPFGDANSMTLELAREMTGVVEETPLIGGVCAVDPFRNINRFLRELKEEYGISGVINYPTVSMYGGLLRKNLEKQGFSYGKELLMIKSARKLDMLTTPYVFNPEEARSMAEVGADILIAHIGYREKTLSLEEAIVLLNRIVKEAREANPEIIVLCHGDPIVDPYSFKYVYKRVEGLAGFMGFAAIERLPVREAIINRLKEFKSIRK